MQFHYHSGESVNFVVHVTAVDTTLIQEIPSTIMLCEA